MVNVGVFGANGRVGQLLVEELLGANNLALSAVYVRNELNVSVPASVLVTNELKTFLHASDVIIDFSLPDATSALLEAALEVPTALVIGTTGLSEHQMNLMYNSAEKMPILYATNMSLGVALLNKLVAMTSKALAEFDIEIVEMHHKHKKDAPSGTALTLAQHAAKARALDLEKVRVSGRNGQIGERSSDEIAVMALRGGDIVGKHTVGFYNDGEFVELSHTATNRSTFSKGAIKAASWLVGKNNGLYSIADALDI